MNFLILFIVTNAINVVISTWKSIVTVNGSKMSAAFWNALGYGYYAWIVILTATGEIPTWQKVVIVFMCNIVGVYAVKWFEEKRTKEKLWKLEMTVGYERADTMHNELTNANIPNNYVIAGPWAVFNCYCYTRENTDLAKAIGEKHHAKFFASESKIGA